MIDDLGLPPPASGPPQGTGCANKANCRRAGSLRTTDCAKQTQLGVSGSDKGCHCAQTKPIRGPAAGGRDTPLFHYSIIPPFPSDVNHAKQTQLGPAGRRTGSLEEENVQNEPNLARERRYRRDQTCETKPIVTEPPFTKPRPAGWGPHSCETKPISGGRDVPAFHYSIIPARFQDPDVQNFSSSAVFFVDIYYYP